jgi:hypothetical protein
MSCAVREQAPRRGQPGEITVEVVRGMTGIRTLSEIRPIAGQPACWPPGGDRDVALAMWRDSLAVFQRLAAPDLIKIAQQRIAHLGRPPAGL